MFFFVGDGTENSHREWTYDRGKIIRLFSFSQTHDHGRQLAYIKSLV